MVTPNPEFMLRARKDANFQALINESHLSIPDGTGLRFAVAALTDDRLSFRHTGTDTLVNLAGICEDLGKKLMLLGGDSESARTAASNLRQQFSQLDVVGVDPGFIEKDEKGQLVIDPDLILKINTEKPAVLAVALGMHKQEKFIVGQLYSLPSVRVAIGVGGAFEMISGSLKRAPDWMRQSGLEWAWRVYLEPKRFNRIWRASVIFPAYVLYDTVRQGRLLRAVRNVFPEIYNQLRGK